MIVASLSWLVAQLEKIPLKDYIYAAIIVFVVGWHYWDRHKAVEAQKLTDAKACVTQLSTRDSQWQEAEATQRAAHAADTAAREAQTAAQLAALTTQHAKDLANVQAQAKRNIDAVANGMRLRIPAPTESGPAVRLPEGSASNGPPETRSEFLGEADSAFLLDLTADADKVATDLNACIDKLKPLGATQ